MKKVFSLLAALLMLSAPVFSVCGSADGNPCIYQVDNTLRQITVSKGKPYTITTENAVQTEEYSDNGSMLTDGIYAPIIDYTGTDWYGSGGWVGFKPVNSDESYTVSVTIDLGYVAVGIDKIYTRTMTEQRIGSATPESVSVAASVDGEHYFEIGNAIVQNEEFKSTEILINRLKLEKGFAARYIRVTYAQSGRYTLMTDEIDISLFGTVGETGSDMTDRQGIIYDISGVYAYVSEYAENRTEKVSGYAYPSNKDFNEDQTAFEIGTGFGENVTLINDFMATDRPYYSNYCNDIKYIVIHNTGMCQKYWTARAVHKYLVYKNDGSSSSWHYTVDGKEVYHGLADYTVGWHAASNYNYCTIGIEICCNGAPVGPGGNNYQITTGEIYENWFNDDFLPALKNAAVLTAELLVKYGLETDDIIQHNDVYYFNQKQCPYYMRLNESKRLVHNGTGWNYFMDLVEQYYSAMTEQGCRTEVTVYPEEKTVPDYIVTESGKAYPVLLMSALLAGDADGDGELTLNDAKLIHEYIIGALYYLRSPDADSDGTVTVADYLTILRTSKTE